MPRGFSGVRRVSAEMQARRDSQGPSALWFRLEDGAETIVRFCEQDEDVFWCHVHEVPVEGRAWGRDVPCCDQEKDGTPCPGCEQELPRKYKGFINLIWQDAPLFKKDGDGKLVRDKDDNKIQIGTKPQIAVWGSGIRLFDELDEINSSFRGLRSRRFRVKRKGKKLNTTYSIKPEDVDSGPQKWTDEEKELENKKYDLNEFTKPPSYNDFLKQLGEAPSQNGGGGGSGEGEGKRPNPFMRKQNT